MDLNTICRLLDADVISALDPLEVMWGAAADLMSDVLAFSQADSLLLTGLVHPQTVRTAEVANIKAIVYVRGKRPPPETVNLAAEIGIALMSTRYTMYEACGRLYAAGLPGLGLVEDYLADQDIG